MPATTDVLPEVYSPSEIALAAGVDARDVLRWGDAHNVRPLNGGFYATPHAVQIVRHLLSTVAVETDRRDLFAGRAGTRRRPGLPTAFAIAAHVCLLAGLAVISTAAGRSRNDDRTASVATELVFLASPGPGGGGGGGGHEELTRAAAAERSGSRRLRSPIPVRPAPDRSDLPRVAPSAPKPKPAVVAPVVAVDADARDMAGEPVDAPWQPESRGPGAEGEAGDGAGGGIGPGNGPGLGAGAGGGTGGGPYRPGSGITPPSLLREVKPDYTEEGRQRHVEGDVDLEIVVRSDGSVGDVKLVSGLGSGLDQRAIEAVRQWRFSPATRQGAPVDVIVQVSVEFRLR